MYQKFARLFRAPACHTLKFKLLLMIKLTTVLLTTAILQVSAAGFAQQITFIRKNATLKQVFTAIYRQTGYSVLLSGANARNDEQMDVNFHNTPLEEVLKTCLHNNQLDFTIEDKMIVIRDNPVIAAPLKDTFFWASGRVVNAAGQPLAGASIMVTTSKSGAVSSADQDGRFKVYVDKGSPITISHVGYESYHTRILRPELGDLILRQQVDSLREVKIVIGYGTTTKVLNTGNVAVVTAEEISRQPVTNVLQALQGRVAGMAVNQVNGFASSPFNVKIRGQNAMATSGNMGVNDLSEPLYIIDGVPIISGALNQVNAGINQNGFMGPTYGQSPLFGLNPDDIESISVLKDADATAIYGARGANGVILITTKKGKPGKTAVNANFYSGVSLQTKKLHLMNTAQYLAMRKQAYINDGFQPEAYDGYDLLSWDQHRYTDWQKEFLQSAHTTNAELSLSGGDNNTTYRLNGGYNVQTPPFQGNFKEQRASMSVNLNNTSFNNKLTTAVMANFSSTTSNLPSADPTSLIFLAPNAPSLLDSAGHLNFEGWRSANGFPYQASYLARPYHAGTINLISNLNIGYYLLPDLRIGASLGYNLTRQNQLSTSPSGSFDPAYGAGLSAEFGTNNSHTWIIEPTADWKKTLGKHHIEAMLGATFQDMLVEGSDINARGFTSDASLENLAAASGYTARSNYADTRFQSVYARLNYNYEGKYVLTLNGRRDGSSRFASGNQFGNFGSAGMAWIFSEERFMRDHASFLSLGKLRVSYGLVGGDGLGDYKYLSSFTAGTNPYQGTPAFVLSRLANDRFGWTTNNKLEVGLALGFLQNKLNTELSFYRNRSGNQLVSEPLPATAGFNAVVENLPALVQNNGVELTLQTRQINSVNFQWSTNFNISANRNKLLRFPDLENSPYYGTYAIGRSINSLGMPHYAGVDKATGLYTFADVNKDGQVDLFGRTDYIYKDNTPAFFGGMGNDFSYHGIQLNVFFSFVKQKGVLRLSNQYPGALSGGLGNQLILSEQLSGKPALENLTTSPYRTDLANYYMSDAVWVDASYIRLQNLSLSYNLPGKWMQISRLQQTKIYLQCQNLLTITGYKGTDPAAPGSFALPPRKIITAGIQLGL